MIDIVIYPGGRLKPCNDQVLKWLILLGVLYLIGHGGDVIVLAQSTQYPVIIFEGNVYKPTAEKCPHAIIIVWSCIDAFSW